MEKFKINANLESNDLKVNSIETTSLILNNKEINVDDSISETNPLITKENMEESLTKLKEESFIYVDIEQYPSLNAFLTSVGVEGNVYLYPIDLSALKRGFYKYIWKNKEWVSLGATIIDLSSYATIESLTTEKEERTKSVEEIKELIEAETSSREDSDTKLQSNIDAEKADRKSADKTLTTELQTYANNAVSAGTSAKTKELDHEYTFKLEGAITGEASSSLVENTSLTINTKIAEGIIDTSNIKNQAITAEKLADSYLKANADITAGTGTKITYDEKGLVTGSASLSEEDIPSLNANKITKGVLDVNRIPGINANKIISGQFEDAVIKSASTWNNKQDALTNTQLAACNSGITSEKVETYDNYSGSINTNTENISILKNSLSNEVTRAQEAEDKLTSSVTTNTSGISTLENKKQDKLIAGNNIAINTDNVISTDPWARQQFFELQTENSYATFYLTLEDLYDVGNVEYGNEAAYIRAKGTCTVEFHDTAISQSPGTHIILSVNNFLDFISQNSLITANLMGAFGTITYDETKMDTDGQHEYLEGCFALIEGGQDATPVPGSYNQHNIVIQKSAKGATNYVMSENWFDLNTNTTSHAQRTASSAIVVTTDGDWSTGQSLVIFFDLIVHE